MTRMPLPLVSANYPQDIFCYYNQFMHSVIETPVFIEWSSKVWSDAERSEFIDWIAENALAGDVIPGTGSLRKVRQFEA
jgi:hypothetical protein